MKTLKFYLAVAIGSVLVVASAQGQNPGNSTMTTTTSSSSSTSLYDMYAANEFSADAFTSLSLGKQSVNRFGNTVREDGRLGLGIGGNYFITRYIGVGADAYSENTTGPFIDSMSASAIGRLPIGDSGFAPYVFVGLGHQFDLVQQTFAQIGAGLEYRLTDHVGFFVDARHVIPDKTDDYGLLRAGFRWRF
jgi:hypothetical protein